MSVDQFGCQSSLSVELRERVANRWSVKKIPRLSWSRRADDDYDDDDDDDDEEGFPVDRAKI